MVKKSTKSTKTKERSKDEEPPIPEQAPPSSKAPPASNTPVKKRGKKKALFLLFLIAGLCWYLYQKDPQLFAFNKQIVPLQEAADTAVSEVVETAPPETTQPPLPVAAEEEIIEEDAMEISEEAPPSAPPPPPAEIEKMPPPPQAHQHRPPPASPMLPPPSIAEDNPFPPAPKLVQDEQQLMANKSRHMQHLFLQMQQYKQWHAHSHIYVLALKIERAFQAGEPFEKLLLSLRQAATGNPRILQFTPALERFASSGITSLERLQRDFDQMSDAVFQAELKKKEEESWLSYVQSHFASVVKIRKIKGEPGSSEPDDIWARAREALRQGDIALATKELALLEDQSHPELAAWQAQALELVKAELALKAMLGHLEQEQQRHQQGQFELGGHIGG